MLKSRITNLSGSVTAEKRVGSRSLHIHDPLGSTLFSYDDTAVVRSTISYWPYGEVLNSTGSIPSFSFCGEHGYYRDSADRLYVRFRTMLQGKGRWATRDPLWPKESPYSYAGCRPTAGADFFGLYLDFSGCGSKQSGLSDCCTPIKALSSVFGPSPGPQTPSVKDAIIECVRSRQDTGAPGGVQIVPKDNSGAYMWPYSSGDITEFIKLLAKLCGGSKSDPVSNRVCVRCADPNGTIPGWPQNCWNPCTGEPVPKGKSKQVYLGYTWSEVKLPNISLENCGLQELDPGCPGAFNSPNGGHCSCSIVLCDTAFVDKSQTPCTVLFHEMSHCSGYGHLGGEPAPGVSLGGGNLDFIYKLACCVCKKTQTTGCGTVCDRVKH